MATCKAAGELRFKSVLHLVQLDLLSPYFKYCNFMFHPGNSPNDNSLKGFISFSPLLNFILRNQHLAANPVLLKNPYNK